MLQNGAPKIAKLPFKWLNYGLGRYIYIYILKIIFKKTIIIIIINICGGYKPTNITWGHHPVAGYGADKPTATSFRPPLDNLNISQEVFPSNLHPPSTCLPTPGTVGRKKKTISTPTKITSMDWFMGKSTGNHRFSH